MMMATVFYYPKWFKDFRCGGHGCCCKFWEIKLTLYDYLQLRTAVSGTVLEPLFRSHIIVHENMSPSVGAGQPPRNHQESTTYNAHMLMTERVYCPFLDNDMHCSIQRLLGKCHLPSVCVNFPMKSHLTIDGILITAEILCPVIRDRLHDATEVFSIFTEDRESFRDLIYGPQDAVIQSVPLTQNVHIPWDQYRKLRNALITALDRIEGPILYRLAVIQTMLSEIWSHTDFHARFEEILFRLQDTHEGFMSIQTDMPAALESV
jgi:Fe-S-cluster containining protein